MKNSSGFGMICFQIGDPYEGGVCTNTTHIFENLVQATGGNT